MMYGKKTTTVKAKSIGGKMEKPMAKAMMAKKMMAMKTAKKK